MSQILCSGNITSANNGGFASVRTKNIEPALDLTGCDGLKIRLRGDGQRYKFMLRTTDNWDSVAFCKLIVYEFQRDVKLDSLGASTPQKDGRTYSSHSKISFRSSEQDPSSHLRLSSWTASCASFMASVTV